MDNRQLIMEKALELFCAVDMMRLGCRRLQNSPELQTDVVLLFWKQAGTDGNDP